MLFVVSPAQASEPVTINNFIRAESDNYFKAYAEDGAFAKIYNIRQPTPIDQQKVIRMNRDTLYSFGIFDLTKPVTIHKPDTGDRFQSMQVINQDQYTTMVAYHPGKYTFTRDKVGTRYVLVLFRTFVDSSNPEDIKTVNALQDQIKFEQASSGKFEIPDWDQKELAKLRDAVNVLASTVSSTKGMFGSKKEVDPILHLLGTAYGWGGNPYDAAIYLNVVPKQNDGKTPYSVTVKDVPVDGFWSISVYNAEGFFQKNQYNSYSVNNRTAKRNADGSVTIHFGGNPSQPNFIPITKGWNYIVRLYRPRKEIIDGSWKFPEAQPAK